MLRGAWEDLEGEGPNEVQEKVGGAAQVAHQPHTISNVADRACIW